jgi:hypothetical protein
MSTEIAPGLLHWTAVHPNHGMTVSSYGLRAEGVLLNPLLGEGDERPLGSREVEAVVLTNRHHLRDAQRAADRPVPIHAPEAGLYDLGGVDPPVRGYRDGDHLPGGLVAHEVGRLSSDEFAVHAPEHRALAVADGVMRDGSGPLSSFPDGLLGDDPQAVRRGLGEAYARLADELDFDHLLLAHGMPVVGDGRTRLAAYAAALLRGRRGV